MAEAGYGPPPGKPDGAARGGGTTFDELAKRYTAGLTAGTDDPAFTRSVGHQLYLAGIQISASIKNDFLYLCPKRRFCYTQADCFCLLGRSLTFHILRTEGSQGVTLHIVDNLGVNIFVRFENRQARSFIGTGNFRANPRVSSFELLFF